MAFRRSAVAVVSTLIVVVCVGGAVLAPLVAPYNPFDLASLNLMDSLIPPAFLPDGSPAHVLGTDDQGRDLLSASCTACASAWWSGCPRWCSRPWSAWRSAWSQATSAASPTPC